VLKASDQIDIATMEFGDYQSILSPLDKWPGDLGEEVDKVEGVRP